MHLQLKEQINNQHKITTWSTNNQPTYTLYNFEKENKLIQMPTQAHTDSNLVHSKQEKKNHTLINKGTMFSNFTSLPCKHSDLTHFNHRFLKIFKESISMGLSLYLDIGFCFFVIEKSSIGLK